MAYKCDCKIVIKAELGSTQFMDANFDDVLLEMAFEWDEYYVQTCGLCETICNEDEVSRHKCLEGYSNFITDKNLYFYPVLDNGVTVVRKSLVQGAEVIAAAPFHEDNQENIDLTTNYNKNTNRKNAKEKLSPDEEEILILEVQYRQPLWNYKLSLAQRNEKITKALWEEVSKALNGKLSGTGCKAKLKNLHDTYRRLINFEKLPSGSASKNINKWRHFNAMNFLQDSCLQKSTVFNINDDENSSSNVGDINEDSLDTNTSGDTISQPLPNLVVPPPPVGDYIDAVAITPLSQRA
ncbi:uncharacterized protein LOC114254575 [Monomorium pharaonis]|uniref:uncharacterized protein LOC114254575 n=1 Tax=Monomorium pharaonis TaxID=307658 RepID=UPI001745EDD7|nr:uncharacterized protein LOC114254575 [Monomorium pharaonis]